MAGITVSYKKEGRISFLTFVGEINQKMLTQNFAEAHRLVGEFKDIALLLDLSGVEYINSGFIGLVSELYSEVDESSGKLVIVGNPVINDTFDLVGFSEFAKVVSTQKEALDELNLFIRTKSFDFHFMN